MFVGGVVAEIGNRRLKGKLLENHTQRVTFVTTGAQFEATIKLKEPERRRVSKSSEQFESNVANSFD